MAPSRDSLVCRRETCAISTSDRKLGAEDVLNQRERREIIQVNESVVVDPLGGLLPWTVIEVNTFCMFGHTQDLITSPEFKKEGLKKKKRMMKKTGEEKGDDNHDDGNDEYVETTKKKTATTMTTKKKKKKMMMMMMMMKEKKKNNKNKNKKKEEEEEK